MAAISKSGTPSVCTMLPGGGNYVGSNLVANAAIAAGDACYILSTGKVALATGAAANAAARVIGFAAAAAAAGEPVTLMDNVDWYYGSGLTPGIPVYLSGSTAGGIDTATSTGGTAPIGYTLDATRIRLWSARY